MAKLHTSLLAAPFALAAMTAPAAAEDETRSVNVHYDDLNLSSANDRGRLSNRINLAVQSVCNSRPNSRPTLRQRAQSRECETLAMHRVEIKLATLLNGRGTRVADQGGVLVAVH